ncbi:transcriptional regulator [Bifidobacterium animalis subsp. animalis MCC 1489]|uniref:Protease synthase and sporulation negative regula tory protein PAI 1 n=2 Tax=Bifidobacterium animalis TaxID=28025 RepID=A0AAV2W425_9BIFI|nr:transcriptional regulator [Bifidobacterium animalis subsp. animalis ATCC 27672]KOA64931.1 transcriptional regulator [Bifidobacterium animalis subsp. animalis MCC 1489]CDI67784.1 Protease synthase and sporulation negative regula tory protein PAI 1 [Bifidobacterium animalis subsp. animalis IM386]
MCLKHELLIYYSSPIAQLRRVVYIQMAHGTGGKELDMSEISIAENTQLQTIRDLSIATFRQTFADTNTEEDMHDYIAHELSPEVLGKELADPLQTFFVATVDGAPAGYMKVNLGTAQTERMPDDHAEVQRLYVLADFKRHGLGTRFMRTAEQFASAHGKQTLWLGVWEHNEPAKAFYRAMGFVETGAHTFVLGSDAQTDLIMKHALTAC